MVLLAALTGCAGDGVLVTRAQSSTPLLDIHLRMIASVGAVETIVRDNPFPTDRDNVAVRAAMTGVPGYGLARFVPERPAGDLYGYRVIVTFGGWPVGGDNYCRNPALTPIAAPADITEVHCRILRGVVATQRGGGADATDCNARRSPSARADGRSRDRAVRVLPVSRRE